MENFVVVNQPEPEIPTREFITEYMKEVNPGDPRIFAGPLVFANTWDDAQAFCHDFMPAVKIVGEKT